jgi:hypothetical protein
MLRMQRDIAAEQARSAALDKLAEIFASVAVK